MISHNWPRLQLEEVAEVAAGNPAPQDTTDFSEDGEPFVRMQDVGREHRTSCLTVSVDKVSAEAIARHRLRLFPAGSVLVPKSGASVNLNHRAMLGRDAYVVSHLAVLVPNRERVIPEYLYAWSQSYDPRHQAQTTSLPSLPLSLIKAAEMPVPPIPEQRCIVDILSRAEGIVRLRCEAEKKAAELIPALFLDMFGDPATNPKGWPVTTLGEVVEEFRYGTSQKSGPTGLPVLRIPNVVGDRLEPAAMKFVAVPEAEANRLRLQHGDMLFVRTNGNPDYVGRSAVFEPEIMRQAGFDGENVLYASYLIRARIRRELLEPPFLQTYLSSAEGRKKLKERCRTSAGQFNINTDGLASIPVPIPTFTRQTDFVRLCHDVFSIQSQQSTATAKAQATFNALLAQLFSTATT